MTIATESFLDTFKKEAVTLGCMVGTPQLANNGTTHLNVDYPESVNHRLYFIFDGDIIRAMHSVDGLVRTNTSVYSIQDGFTLTFLLEFLRVHRRLPEEALMNARKLHY